MSTVDEYLARFERICVTLGGRACMRRMAEVRDGGRVLPVDALVMGPRDPTAPCLLLVGGVHGLERIGTEVVLSYAEALADRATWDRALMHVLTRVRVVVMPLVNPVGMRRGTRCNGRGVDLMRNAPPHPSAVATPLVGGQRISRHLPWFAGEPYEMEHEALALLRLFEEVAVASRLCIAIDCHSGFGFDDRLWFPYARSRERYPRLAEVVLLGGLLDRCLPHHPYVLEPQARTYTIAGDLWDHMVDIRAATGHPGAFLPFTLEMGSFTWIRKNPTQLLEPWGSFNPIVPHRRRRVLRRHVPLMEFLLSVAFSPEVVTPADAASRIELEEAGYRRWR